MQDSSTQQRILIVDDERSIADTLAIILTKAGYDASAAYSGDSAIAIAQRTIPALIVSDIQMPGMDGMPLRWRFASCFPIVE